MKDTFLPYDFGGLSSFCRHISLVLQHLSSHCLSGGQSLGIHFIGIDIILQNSSSGQQTEPHFLSNGHLGLSNNGLHLNSGLSQNSSLSQHLVPQSLILGQGGWVALVLHSPKQPFMLQVTGLRSQYWPSWHWSMLWHKTLLALCPFASIIKVRSMLRVLIGLPEYSLFLS